MNLNDGYYQNLFERFLTDDLSSFEINELFEFISNNPEALNLIINREEDIKIFEKLIQNSEVPESISQRMHDQIISEVRNKKVVDFSKSFQKAKNRKVHYIKYWWVAASVIITSSIFFWGMNQSNHKRVVGNVNLEKEITSPIVNGNNDALLILSDGSQISLDAEKDGLIAMQGGSQINLKNGYLIYDKMETGNHLVDLPYNTIYTPKGKTFKTILSDNTIVWLNSESSISYPANFSENERKIKITGEVYFEVSEDKSKPFVVQVGKETEIKVLGTHFNVNSYKNEREIKTTLFEGAVEVKAGNSTKSLYPGEQAAINSENEITVNNHVDFNHALAWKNGVFSFVNADLPLIMRELSRWYDFEVVYSKQIPKMEFTGEIGRNLTLSQVLKILKYTRVEYKIDKNRVIIQ